MGAVPVSAPVTLVAPATTAFGERGGCGVPATYQAPSPLLGSLQDTVVPRGAALERLRAEESVRFGLEEESVFPPPNDMWADEDWEPGSGSVGVKEVGPDL